MLFNSYLFVFAFLPIVLLFYYCPKNRSLSQIALLVASLLFYAYWDFHYLPLLLFSILCNFTLAHQILRTRSRIFFVGGIVFNLSLLFCFKYLSFTLGQFNIQIAPLTLPLGISFFTFTQLAFLVDVYERKISSVAPISYALFVTVFPHMIAGPILHHEKMMPQFEDDQRFSFDFDRFSKGLIYFVIGLCKKLLIADFLSPMVTLLFDSHSGAYTCKEAWVGALSYTFQLYFDFSGYSDMAVGLGRMMNLDLPINFHSPYKASSIIEFWRRWHISLSLFLRDYLYIPLGGNRLNDTRKYLNLFITMMLGGIWHGAGWTFLVWGGLHGVYLIVNHLLKNKVHLPYLMGWFLTFFVVMIGWIIFRSSHLLQAWMMIKGLFAWHTVRDPLLYPARKYGYLLLAAFIALLMPNSNELCERLHKNRFAGWSLGFAMVCCIACFERISEFLYFQF